MEIILTAIAGFVAGVLLNKFLTPNNSLGGTIHASLNDYSQVNTSLLKTKQRAEDKSHYDNYVYKRLDRDIKYLTGCWRKTTSFITDNPHIKLTIDQRKIKKIRSNYSEYVFMCRQLKIGKSMILSIEEFLIMQENPLYCKVVDSFMYVPETYEIFDESEAKYSGNISKLLEEQFRKEWY